MNILRLLWSPLASQADDSSLPENHLHVHACRECDLLVTIPTLKHGEKANCPRCSHTLARYHNYPAQRCIALALTALLALGMALSFPFVSFSVKGIGSHISLSQAATSLIGFQQPLVAVAVLLTIIVLPALYLLGVIWLHAGLIRHAPLPASTGIARVLAHLQPWMMADVFVIGALVALIKVAAMAHVGVGPAFWAFCVFALLLLFTTQSINTERIWSTLVGEPHPPENICTGKPSAEQGLSGCPTCGQVNRLKHGHGQCQRCGERLRPRQPHSLQSTWALLSAAAVLYFPANLYPIMTITTLGQGTPSTIIGGVVELIHLGDWPVALVIFVASVIVPIGKLLTISWLCLVAEHSSELNAAARTRLYRITEFIGRWSMLDVFVVAILVALIHAGTLMSITPGPAALAFGSVVVLTMLAAMAFDPRLIWDSPLPKATHPLHQSPEGTSG